MKRGKWYWVHWADITSEDASDPKKARLTECLQCLIFHEMKTESLCGRRIPVAVFRLSQYQDDDMSQDGWLCIPKACLLKTRPAET